MSKGLLLVLALCGALPFVISGGKTALLHHRSAPSSPSSIAAGQERLRFDGLYQGTTRTGDQLPLRFYPAGDVLLMSGRGSADVIAEVISRRRQELGRGLYHLRETDLAFTLTNPYGLTDYEGTVGPDGIVFSIHSHITNFSDTVKFSFYPASFPSD